jgi:hypothetical protein
MIGRTCGALVLVLSAVTAAAQPAPQRPFRVGNVNLVTAGGGSARFDHPNFDDGPFPSIAYQRRVLRREIRPVPIWLRAALQYQSDDARFDGYTVWSENDESPFGPEGVSERTRDIALRFEAIGDLLHRSNMALYGGVGFVLHSLAFTSDGVITGIPTFEATLTDTSPSVLGGFRIFTATQPYTGYIEARYGRAFGKTADYKGRPFLTDVTFEFTSVDALFVEGGVGFHW